MARQATRAALHELSTLIASENTGGVGNVSLVWNFAQRALGVLQVVAQTLEAVQLVNKKSHHWSEKRHWVNLYVYRINRNSSVSLNTHRTRVLLALAQNNRRLKRIPS
jgi:hypothetical protein